MEGCWSTFLHGSLPELLVRWKAVGLHFFMAHYLSCWWDGRLLVYISSWLTTWVLWNGRLLVYISSWLTTWVVGEMEGCWCTFLHGSLPELLVRWKAVGVHFFMAHYLSCWWDGRLLVYISSWLTTWVVGEMEGCWSTFLHGSLPELLVRWKAVGLHFFMAHYLSCWWDGRLLVYISSWLTTWVVGEMEGCWCTFLHGSLPELLVRWKAVGVHFFMAHSTWVVGEMEGCWCTFLHGSLPELLVRWKAVGLHFFMAHYLSCWWDGRLLVYISSWLTTWVVGEMEGCWSTFLHGSLPELLVRWKAVGVHFFMAHYLSCWWDGRLLVYISSWLTTWVVGEMEGCWCTFLHGSLPELLVRWKAVGVHFFIAHYLSFWFQLRTGSGMSPTVIIQVIWGGGVRSICPLDSVSAERINDSLRRSASAQHTADSAKI